MIIVKPMFNSSSRFIQKSNLILIPKEPVFIAQNNKEIFLVSLIQHYSKYQKRIN